MATPMSKEDYLKRYISSEDGRKKKKRVKKSGKPNPIQRSRVVDDDIDIKSIAPKEGVQYDVELGEDAPQVAGFVDERPEDVQKRELFSQKDKWRVLGGSSDNDDSNSIADVDGASNSVTGRWSSKAVKENSDDERSNDLSPFRRKRLDSNSDESPPRRPMSEGIERRKELSPLRRNRHDSGSDLSPPRSSRRNSGSDNSPPRKSKKDSDSDQTPPRRRQRNNSESDQSPPRRSRRSETPEKIKKSGERMKKTLDGKRAGLQDAATLRKENEAAKERERKLYEKAGDKMLGRNAETIVRDRSSGRKRDFEAERLQKEEDEAIKKAREDKYKQWSKGLTQSNLQSERLETDLRTVSKPLARYKDDKDLDKFLREREHQDDPMLDFIRKKKRKAAGQDPAKELPKYNGPPPPPNRYGIEPGYRWDGVDRSNGFEKARVTRHNDRLANLEQAYKWSVEDM